MTRFPAVRRAIIARKSFLTSLMISTGLIIAASLLRWLTWSMIPNLLYVAFFPAVLIIGLLLGWRWGASAIIASAIVANGILPAGFSSALSLEILVGLLSFLLSSAVVVVTADTLRRTVRDLETARRAADFLNEELQHRVGNTLAIVQAMATQTLRVSGAREFPRAFGSRLRALGKANRLMGLSSENGCNLRDLVTDACVAFVNENNFRLEGPQVVVPSPSCVPLSLCLHELCTNAMKYGALSVPDGKVLVSWSMSGDNLLSLLWKEFGGPPVAPPSRTGMGTRLLTRQAGVDSVEVRFPAEGVCCEICVRI